jgi:hypothetical protein
VGDSRLARLPWGGDRPLWWQHRVRGSAGTPRNGVDPRRRHRHSPARRGALREGAAPRHPAHASAHGPHPGARFLPR